MTPDDPPLVTDDPPIVADDPSLVTDDPEVDKDADGLELHREGSRSRRLAGVFGDVLSDSTRDDVDHETPGERARSGSRDDEMLRDVPPHHG